MTEPTLIHALADTARLLAAPDAGAETLERALTNVSQRTGVGSAARESVRSADLVGHLGAGRFALLFPRAGTFEARAAFRRVRDALVGVEYEGSGLVCGQAGYAELCEDGSGDLLHEALTRLKTARTRHAYTGPVGPSSPTQPLAG